MMPMGEAAISIANELNARLGDAFAANSAEHAYALAKAAEGDDGERFIEVLRHLQMSLANQGMGVDLDGCASGRLMGAAWALGTLADALEAGRD